MKIGDMLVTTSLSEMQRIGEEGARTVINELRRQLDESKRQNAQLTADFDRRTDILNNHIAREKTLEARIKTLEDALLEIARHNLGIHKTALSCAISPSKTHAVKEPKAVVCECGVTIIGEFTTDGDGNPICPICLGEAAKEPTATACNCAGCNPANYPETNGWKCGMHTAKEPKA